MLGYQYDIQTKQLLESFEFDDFSNSDAEEMENEFFQADTTSSDQDKYQQLIDDGYYNDVIALCEKEIIKRIFCSDYYQNYFFDENSFVKPTKQILVSQCKTDKSKFMVHYIIAQNNSVSICSGLTFPIFIIDGAEDNIVIIESFDYVQSQPSSVYNIKFCDTLYNNSFAYMISLQTMCVASAVANMGFNTSIAFYSYRENSDDLTATNLFVNPEYDDSIYNNQSFSKENIDLFLKAIETKEKWFEIFGKHKYKIYEIFVNTNICKHPNAFSEQYCLIDIHKDNIINFEFEKSYVFSEAAYVIPSISELTKKFCKKHNINHNDYCGKAMMAKTYTLMQHGVDPTTN